VTRFYAGQRHLGRSWIIIVTFLFLFFADCSLRGYFTIGTAARSKAAWAGLLQAANDVCLFRQSLVSPSICSRKMSA
jgi:hypothetical protein